MSSWESCICTLHKLDGLPPNLMHLGEQGICVKHSAMGMYGKDVGLVLRKWSFGYYVFCTGQVTGKSLIQRSRLPPDGLGVVWGSYSQEQKKCRRSGYPNPPQEFVHPVHFQTKHGGWNECERKHMVEDYYQNMLECGGMRRSEVVNLLCKSLMIASTSCCWWHSIIVVIMDGFVSMLIQFVLTCKTTHYSLFKNWGEKKT